MCLRLLISLFLVLSVCVCVCVCLCVRLRAQRYVSGKEKFVWDKSSEESYRVAGLTSIVAPLVDGTWAPCSEARQFGAKPAGTAKSIKK